MTNFTVVKLSLEGNISILGAYSTRLLAIDYCLRDIETLRSQNKFLIFETQINDDNSITVVKKNCGYLYNTKDVFLKYIVIEITDEVVEN